MSRFYEGDGDDVLAAGRWEANRRRAIKGKRGQKVLRELRDALLALPERRLISGDLATPRGEVCTVGALVAYKRAQANGVPIAEAIVELAAEDPLPFDDWTWNEQAGHYERQEPRFRGYVTRAVARLIQPFGLIDLEDGRLAVPTLVPFLTADQVVRLPEHLRAGHRLWEATA